MGICLSSYAQTVINYPTVSRSNTRIVEITKIELLKDATVLHITATNPPNLWVSFSSKTILRDPKTSRTYELLKCDGYPLDKEHYMSKGRQEFKMYFAPLDANVSKVDFIEGNQSGAFRLSGIVIRNTIVMDNLEPAIHISASPGETIVIPAKTLRKFKKDKDLIIRITDR